MTIAEALQRAKLDPEMKKKSFYEQQMVIRAIVDQLVLDDPQFRSVPDSQKAIVYQNVVNQAVGNWMPALNSYDQPLTDEDRAALERGLFADVPGTQDSYKRGLWILERLQAGDPRAAKEAEKWIVGNSAKTNSLLVQVSAGAKDAIETLFSGDKPWNSLALNTQDFHKIADAMYQQMPSNVASQTETLSGLTGMAIAAGETIALNVLFVGGPGRAALMAGKWPGLFTQKMWNAVKAKELAQVTLRSKTLWGVTIPNVLDAAIGGGLTDLVRSFPRLIEAGAIQGPEKFWKQVVNVFGQGMAWDLLFNTFRVVRRFAGSPLRKAISGMDAGDLGVATKALVDADGYLTPESVSKLMNDVLVGKVNGELLDSLDPPTREFWYNKLTRLHTILSTPELDPNSPKGFSLIAHAMGYDAAVDPVSGIVRLFDDSSPTVLAQFKSKAEAMSFFVKQNFNPSLVDDFLLGGDMNVRIKAYKATTMNAADLPTQDLTHMIGASFNGATVDEDTVAGAIREIARRGGTVKGKISVEFVSEDDFLQSLKFRPSVPIDESVPILLPKTMLKPGTQDTVLKYLDPILQGVNREAPSLVIGHSLPTLDSLDMAMHRLGGRVSLGGPRGYQVKFNDGTVLDMSDLGSVNTLVWDTLLKNGMVSPEEYGELLYRATGLTLKVSADEMGNQIFSLWGIDKHGKSKLFQQTNSMEDLSAWASVYRIKLPDFLMPDLIIRKGKVEIGETMVAGPVASLRKFAADFDNPRANIVQTRMKAGMTTKHQLADGSWATVEFAPGGKFYQVEWPSVGVSKTFTSLKEVENFLSKVGNTFDEIELAAARKGFRVELSATGGYVFHDGVNAYSARTLTDAQKFLQAIPDKYEGPDLVTVFGPETDVEIAAGVQKHVDKLTYEPPKKTALGAKISTGTSVWRNNLEAMYRPARAYIDDAATRFKMPELAQYADEATAMRRVTGLAVQRTERVLQGIFTDPATGKVMKAADRKIIQRLLEWDPSLWDVKAAEFAQQLGIDFKLGKFERDVLENLKNFYATTGKAFDIDFLGFMRQYAPHYRDYSDPVALAEILKLKRDQIAQEVFKVGRFSELPELQFLSRNSRLDAIMMDLHQGDAYKVAMTYASNGFREVYLGPTAEKSRQLLAKRGKELPSMVLDKLRDQYMVLIGGYTDRLSQHIAETSLSITGGIARNLMKVSEQFGEDSTAIGRGFQKMAEGVISSDIPNDLSRTISMSTLGFRWVRLLTNTAQYVNTWAVYGPYATRAMAAVDKDTIIEYFNRGILDDKILAPLEEGLPTLKNTIKDIGMSPNRVSEWLTRAWTAKAQEMSFDEALQLVSKGKINLNTFTEIARIDWFPENKLNQILELVKEGTPRSIGAARNQAMTQAVSGLMFDYAREDWPMLFQTTLGRIFGKFGVYPAGQIELYRSLVSRGRPGLRVDRMVRLVAGFTLLKNAFNAAGIDYAGFNMTDPLAFSGSPLWNSLIDLTRLGSQGPEGQLARYSFQKNWLPFIWKSNGTIVPNIPRLAIPGGVQLNYLQKAISDFDTDSTWGTLLDAMGAPRATEPWTGIKMPW